MKKVIFSFFGFGLFLLFVCSLFSITASAMTVEISVTLSNKADTPAVIDSTETLTLTFSEPLNPDSVTAGVKFYRVKSTGDLVEEPCKVYFDNNTPALLKITKQDGTKFAEGEEYKIVISNTIKSTNGTSIGKDISGYFATNYTFNLGSAGIPELNNKRSLIICVSDLHAVDARAIAGGYSGFVKYRDAFVGLLNQIRLAPNVRELIIDGDLFDEWIGPMGNEPLNGMTESGFLDSIAAANSTMIDAINNIIKDGQIKVTYIPGNHDMLVTAADITRTFPGISQARDAQGLGAYTPVDHPEILIEHGHRYEFFDAPDPVSNRSITQTDSILPCGFFLARVVYSSIVENLSTLGSIPAVTVNTADENEVLCYLYWKIWNFFLTYKPVSEGLNDKVLKTGIDGYTETYAINDVIPYNRNGNGPLDVNLFKGVGDTWEERQTKNLVQVKIGAKKAIIDFAEGMATLDLSAFDDQAITQYFHNAASTKRIVVFGHTHKACIKPSFNLKQEQTIYANSGTWQDSSGDPHFLYMTFVVITPQRTSDSTPEYVTLYQYSQDGTVIKKIDQSAITNLTPVAGVKDGTSYK